MEFISTMSSENQNPLTGSLRDSIRFEDLNVNDQILIRTRNSAYHLMVLDPQKRHGILTGGSLVGNERRVVWVESLEEDPRGFLRDLSELRRGARSFFYLDSPSGIDRMITSTITDLILLRFGAEPSTVV
jgi:hypothetical protein